MRPRRHRPVARHGWSAPPRTIPRGALLTALATAALLLIISSSNTLGATMVTPRCDDVRLRIGPGTTHASKTNVDEGAQLTVVSTVSGGSYSANCAGSVRSGSNWHKISAVNGSSVSSLYGVNHVYGAAKLFKTVINPTPAPTSAPTTDPGTTPAPTVLPSTPPDPSTPPGPVTLPASITVHGRGWGHGVGLSQYGAHGRALDGQSAATILAHYFKGTTLGTIADKQVRVLVLQSFGATSSKPVEVYGRGGEWTIDGIVETFPADALLRFVPTTSGTTTTWKAIVKATDGTTLHSGTTNPKIRVRPGAGATLQLWSTPSAHDRFRGVLRLIGGAGASSTVNVVNELPMETYLRGVVPAEISPGWPKEAIRAQAIAARSYAAYRLHPDTGTFDFYNDTRSQVYFGQREEEPSTDAAITATAGKVVRTSKGGIANTLFHSCGGGATEHNENVYVSSTGAKVAGVYSYLRGSMDRRPDGTAYDSASPNAKWKTATYTRAQIQAWFAADSRSNVGTLVAIDLRNRGVSGRLISVTLIGANGTTKKVAGDVFRSIFNAHRPAADPSMKSSLFDLSPVP